jgi:hypothetical protein
MRGTLAPKMKVRGSSMRRVLPVLFGCVLLALPVFAQRGGHGGGGGGAHAASSGGFHGGSSGGFHGGASVGGFRGGTGFRGNYGGYRGGIRGYGYRGYYPGFYGAFYNPYLWNYGYPWDSGYGWDYNGSGYASDYNNVDPNNYVDPNANAYNSYAPPSPSVIIVSNQGPPPEPAVQPPPAPAVWNAARPAQAQSQKYEDQLFLVAMRDGTIHAVVAYWVDGMTVHYVTMDHEQKQTPLASVDRTLSERLNRERNVTFRLPG